MRSTKVQPMLWRMTAPSLRTNFVVDTPTLAVCGATGLPISAPTELRVGSSKGGKFSNWPTSAWNLPNIAFVEVLLPERASRCHDDEDNAELGKGLGQRARHAGIVVH